MLADRAGLTQRATGADTAASLVSVSPVITSVSLSLSLSSLPPLSLNTTQTPPPPPPQSQH